MQVTIQSAGITINSDFETQIRRKLQFSFSRIEPYITTISISINSVTNIIDHSDIHCRLTLDIVNQPSVVIEDTQMTLECVIDRVLQKASRIIERLVFTS